MILTLVIGCTVEPAEPGFAVVADQVPGGTLLGAWSSGPEIWFAGGDLALGGGEVGTLVRYDGEQLCTEVGAAPATLWWIHGAREGDWYAVGGRGTILHETDGVRVDESVPTESTLFGVFAAADGRVWAVGGDPHTTQLGEVWVREDGAWRLFADQLPGVVFKVWDRWFVGDGRSWHLEGDALVEVPLPSATKLLTVRGRADDDVWAVGGSAGPALLHWDGAAWTEVAVDLACSSQPLNGVWTGPGEDVWIAGSTGAMARRADDGSWDCPRPPITYEHFHAVWAHEGEVWWAGGNLFSTTNNYGTIGRWSSAADPLPQPTPCAGAVRSAAR